MTTKVIEDSIGPNGTRITTVQLSDTINNYIDLLQYHELSITNQENYEFCGLSLIITSTQWDAFLAKSPEYGDVKKALNASTPTVLKAGEWHLPFVDKDDDTALDCIMDYRSHPDRWREYKDVNEDYADMSLVNISAARCIRYKKSWDILDIEKDLDKARDIRSLGNWSPFEHQAQAINIEDYRTKIVSYSDALPFGMEVRLTPGCFTQDFRVEHWSRNFKNWIQAKALLDS